MTKHASIIAAATLALLAGCTDAQLGKIKALGNTAKIQCYSGVAPVVARSGQQRWVHWRWSCPKFLRQTFQEWALHSIAQSQWARDYYEQKRAQGKSHHTVVRALAFKWIRILFRCWKDRQSYDEQLYQGALAQRRPKPGAGQTVELQWKTVAGFSKLSTLPS